MKSLSYLGRSSSFTHLVASSVTHRRDDEASILAVSRIKAASGETCGRLDSCLSSSRLSRLANPLFAITTLRDCNAGFARSVPVSWVVSFSLAGPERRRRGSTSGHRGGVTAPKQQHFHLRALTPGAGVRHCELGGLRLSLGIGARRGGGTPLGHIVQLDRGGLDKHNRSK